MDTSVTYRLFQPAKTAMQSGFGKSREWVLEPEPVSARHIDPLMGYTTSADTHGQLRLTFTTKEEGLAYAKANGLTVRVFDAKPRKAIKKSYAANFSHDRLQPWSH